MSYYETEAEESGYFLFEKRPFVKTPLHFHGAKEFAFVEKGQTEVAISGEKRILKSGEGCFVDSFCAHGYMPAENSSVYFLLGNSAIFERAFSAFGNLVPERFFRFDRFDALSLMLSLYGEKNGDPDYRQAIFASAVQTVAAVLEGGGQFTVRDVKKSDAIVSEILKYAENNLEKDLSLESLSDIFGYSREHISRLLHKFLPENWSVYVGRMRVRRAKNMIASAPEESILKIALDCGFDSANTFYRAYNREFGAPPRKINI